VLESNAVFDYSTFEIKHACRPSAWQQSSDTHFMCQDIQFKVFVRDTDRASQLLSEKCIPKNALRSNKEARDADTVRARVLDFGFSD